MSVQACYDMLVIGARDRPFPRPWTQSQQCNLFTWLSPVSKTYVVRHGICKLPVIIIVVVHVGSIGTGAAFRASWRRIPLWWRGIASVAPGRRFNRQLAPKVNVEVGARDHAQRRRTVIGHQTRRWRRRHRWHVHGWHSQSARMLRRHERSGWHKRRREQRVKWRMRWTTVRKIQSGRRQTRWWEKRWVFQNRHLVADWNWAHHRTWKNCKCWLQSTKSCSQIPQFIF